MQQNENFFQSFFGSQEQYLPISEDMAFNTIALDISNNWDSALEFYNKYKNKQLKDNEALDQFDYNCYIFITKYNIELDTFVSSNEFLELVWKNLNI
ncbi:hypothetical protein M0Q50_06335 [bacterium]|jgi:hypothetical protein|nr:hypothetical protein [bacterium]